MDRTVTCAALLLIAGAVPRATDAQLSPRRRLVVIVQSAADKSALADVDVTVFAGNQTAVAHGTTGPDGRATVTVPAGADAARIVARKIGYLFAEHAVDPFGGDATVRLSLVQQVQVLEKVTTRIDLRGKNYFVGAADIENANRGLFDALIVLQKLRPQMLGDVARFCPPTDKVWINGRRVMFGPIPAFSTRTHLSQTGPPPMTADPAAARSSELPLNVRDTILTLIKGEHIAEMRYINCWDDPPEGLMRDALYITLRAGVDWDWGHGSFIADEASATAWNHSPR